MRRDFNLMQTINRFGRSRGTSWRSNSKLRIHHRRLLCEPLEDRRLLSVVAQPEPFLAYSADFTCGDYVRVIAPLNVRTNATTGAPEISDPDYPGEAPGGTVGVVTDGPRPADGYTWWEVNYGAGSYTGWSSDHRLENACSTARVAGIDVSHHQGDVGWSQVFNSGHTFAFARATYSDGGSDSEFVDNMMGGTGAGLYMGAYHFAYPDRNPNLTGPDSAESEANNFVNVARPYITEGYLRPVLDIERQGGSGTDLSAWVRKWLQAVEAQTGVEPIVYTSSDYANNHLDSSLNTYDLWIAHWTYDLRSSPNDGVWDTWSLWQYSGDNYGYSGIEGATVPGINGVALTDVFNGDLSSFRSKLMITEDQDLIAPTVDFFDVSPASVDLGESFAISCTVSDTGGSGLNRVELWRTDSAGPWQEVVRTSVSGDGPISRYFADAPPSVGQWWYGIHVVDNANNLGQEPDPPGSIQVTVIVPDNDDNYEPNDSLEMAYDLSSYEQTWLSNIDDYGIQQDDDWYKIDVTSSDEQVLIDCRFTHGEGDIDIVLYDSSGTLLDFSESTTDNEYIDYLVPSGGTYYVLVYYGDAGNSYDLWWNAVGDNYEPNDSLETAYDLSSYEQTWLSSIDGYGTQRDDDWYKIDVTPSDEQVLVDCRFTHSEGDIDIRLYDSSGTLLDFSESTTDNEYIDYLVPSGGTYYVLVYYGDAGNSYDLWWNDQSLLPGDANIDWIVNDEDASILAAHWQQTGMDWGDGDFNNDGIVNDRDASIMAAHWLESVEGMEGDAPVEPEEAAKPDRAKAKPVVAPKDKQDPVQQAGKRQLAEGKPESKPKGEDGLLGKQYRRKARIVERPVDPQRERPAAVPDGPKDEVARARPSEPEQQSPIEHVVGELGAMPTLAVGMSGNTGKQDMPTASVGMAPNDGWHWRFASAPCPNTGETPVPPAAEPRVLRHHWATVHDAVLREQIAWSLELDRLRADGLFADGLFAKDTRSEKAVDRLLMRYGM